MSIEARRKAASGKTTRDLRLESTGWVRQRRPAERSGGFSRDVQTSVSHSRNAHESRQSVFMLCPTWLILVQLRAAAMRVAPAGALLYSGSRAPKGLNWSGPWCVDGSDGELSTFVHSRGEQIVEAQKWTTHQPPQACFGRLHFSIHVPFRNDCHEV